MCEEGHVFKDTEIPDMSWCGHILQVCLLSLNSMLKLWVGRYWYGIFFSKFCRNEIKESANNWILKYKNMLRLLVKICWVRCFFITWTFFVMFQGWWKNQALSHWTWRQTLCHWISWVWKLDRFGEILWEKSTLQ